MGVKEEKIRKTHHNERSPDTENSITSEVGVPFEVESCGELLKSGSLAQKLTRPVNGCEGKSRHT